VNGNYVDKGALLVGTNQTLKLI